MAYIQPDSTILICKDIPLNASYDDTLTFYGSDGNWDYLAQYNYFASKTSELLTKEKYSIVRERQGVLRVEGDVGKWETVNYMVFTNKNFLDKHFYAFINKAEYVNPNTTFLYFQLDVMQTWLGDVKFKESLIDREHVEDDSLYANLEDEGIQVQERLPYDSSYNFEPYIGQKMLVIGATENPYNYLPGTSECFNFSCGKIKAFPVICNKYTISDIKIISPDELLNEPDLYKVIYDVQNKWFYVPMECNKFKFKLDYEGFIVSYEGVEIPQTGSIMVICERNDDNSYTYEKGDSNG